ncbi:MAG TPA: septum formation family protein [Pseudonocardiaceae bacterium]|jgi:hypothetical protein|nr:septum formation family protein [Pseudonocardiaceae bacterium]
MAGAAAGAVLVLVLSVAMGWTTAPGAGVPDPAQVAASAAVGSCLTWTQPNEQDLAQVDCAQPHLFEVTGSADVSGAFPGGAAFPTGSAWQQITQQDCTTSATSYLGTIDPNGKYVVGALKPTAQLWASGSRTLRCGLQGSDQAGGLMRTTGPAKGQDQSDVYQPGVCLALVNKGPGGPVGCNTEHSYEIVGIADLGSKFPSGYPSVDDQQTALATMCEPIAAAYTANLDLAKYQLTLTWDTIKQQSWAAGSHKVNCEIGSRLSDGSGLGPVANSVAGAGGGAAGSAAATTTTLPGG